MYTMDDLVAAASTRRAGELVDPVVALVGRLREEMSRLGRPVWSLDDYEIEDTAPLVHLPPPGTGDERSVAWQLRFRYGLCYFRRGPGFAVVRDGRKPTTTETVIAGTDEMRAWELLQRPVRSADLRGPLADTGAALAGAGLLFERRGWTIALPYRLRHWPIPYLAI